MARIDVDIEDYLDEVDTRFLVREFQTRKKAGKLIKEIAVILDELDINGKWPEIKTVLDQQKQDWVIENWDKLTI